MRAAIREPQVSLQVMELIEMGCAMGGTDLSKSKGRAKAIPVIPAWI